MTLYRPSHAQVPLFKAVEPHFHSKAYYDEAQAVAVLEAYLAAHGLIQGGGVVVPDGVLSDALWASRKGQPPP